MPDCADHFDICMARASVDSRTTKPGETGFTDGANMDRYYYSILILPLGVVIKCGKSQYLPIISVFYLTDKRIINLI